jgi:UDP-glucuronate decarboxylase
MHLNDGRVVSKLHRQDDPVRRCPNIALAKAKLRWEPTVPLREGFIRTIEYFRSHPGILPG